MKSIVFLYAGFKNSYAFKNIYDEKSSFDLALDWAFRTSDFCVIAVSPETEKNASQIVDKYSLGEKVRFVCEENWSSKSLISALNAECKKNNADYAVFALADSPFLDDELTKEAVDTHLKYHAEYTFVDGYPLSLAPEILDSGLLGILEAMISEGRCKTSDSEVTNASIFNLLKTDINAFEIETVIASEDFRQLRLDFSTNDLRGFLSCKEVAEILKIEGKKINAQNISECAKHSSRIQMTVPSFYTILLSNAVASSSVYNPFCRLYKCSGENVMSLEQFSDLVGKISAFSGDAVISLGGGWTEPCVLGENLCSYIQTVLAYENLSLLIETDGFLLTENLTEKIENILKNAKPRIKKNQNPLTWIVALDAFSAKTYSQIHNVDKFDQTVKSIELLCKHFPNVVYPQFTRMNANEAELEPFYRYWHEKTSPSSGNLIIQKYDSFCALLPNEKPADLSPLVRNPCWHAKRDMVILPGGQVLKCKECLLEEPVGNVFTEEFSAIWESGRKIVQEHIECSYTEKCEKCDEYYTFNF